LGQPFGARIAAFGIKCYPVTVLRALLWSSPDQRRAGKKYAPPEANERERAWIDELLPMRILPGGAQKGKVSLRARHVVIGRACPNHFPKFFTNVEPLAHCAKQRDDTELDLWMSEIKLRRLHKLRSSAVN
jgi:hypothetical protein